MSQSICSDSTGLDFVSPHTAADALASGVEPVGVEQVALHLAGGRVLAQPVTADRDSPPADVSAMDGYAVRLDEATGGHPSLPVVGEVAIGQAPPILPTGTAMKIATGACVPAGADAIIPRELLVESDSAIAWTPGAFTVKPGQHIRRRGENRRADERVTDAGVLIDAGIAAALAGFGVARPLVRRALSVCVITTGDELLAAGDKPTDWQIRNSNGPAITAALSALPWVGSISTAHAADTAEGVASAIEAALRSADAVITTGGVSMGDHDYVPGAIASIGGRTIYHKLPMRPGKPNLGALSADGRPILALPGNPVSVLVAIRVLVLPVLRRLAGLAVARPHRHLVVLDHPCDKTLPLWWYRPVRLTDDGSAQLLPSKGSGDFASVAGAGGWIETPPGGVGSGPWPYYDGRLT